MTTAYAYASQDAQRWIPAAYLQLDASAPAQGREAKKMRENVRAISLVATRGHSAEAVKLSAAVRGIAKSIEAPRAMPRGSSDELSYNHIPLKPAFSVQATYKFIGKLKPRQFPLDE